MRQETINIYEYHELSEKAQQKARDLVRGNEYVWVDEGIHSLGTFCRHYGIYLEDWSLDPYSYSYVKTSAEGRNFRGVTLKQLEAEKDLNPTGYCMDFPLFNTMYEAMKENGGNALEAFKSAVEAWKKGMLSDMEFQDSDAYITETIEANGYEFLENGARA